MKRVLLFLLTNILVIATISIVLNLLGINSYLTESGIDYRSLLIFCAVWGMGGSFISLAMSKQMAKWMMGVKVIDPRSAGSAEQNLLAMVRQLSTSAGLSTVPEVGIYESPEVNAFATGPSKNNSLVAVSTGLLNQMNRDELEGVLSHEIAHIANGDMVTMTLIQGVINAFVMFLARVAAFAVSNLMRSDDEESSPWLHFGLVFLFDMVFTILGSIVVAGFSRYREFRADAGGARIGGKSKMIAALSRLQANQDRIDPSHRSMASLKMSGSAGGLFALFMTHPPLQTRIERLRQSA